MPALGPLQRQRDSPNSLRITSFQDSYLFLFLSAPHGKIIFLENLPQLRHYNSYSCSFRFSTLNLLFSTPLFLTVEYQTSIAQQHPSLLLTPKLALSQLCGTNVATLPITFRALQDHQVWQDFILHLKNNDCYFCRLAGSLKCWETKSDYWAESEQQHFRLTVMYWMISHVVMLTSCCQCLVDSFLFLFTAPTFFYWHSQFYADEFFRWSSLSLFCVWWSW